MESEFSPEQVKEMVRMARVYASAFSEERFRAMVECQGKLGETGFFEAAWALLRLQREMGVPCHQALDRYQQLIGELRELASSQQELLVVNGNLQEARSELATTLEAVNRARREKEQVDKELDRLRAKARREKEGLETEVDRAREVAGVSQEEVAVAGKLKTELERRGLQLSQVLDMVQGFPEGERNRERVMAAWQEQGSLLPHVAKLRQTVGEVETKQGFLAQECQKLERRLGQLKGEAAQEEEAHGFYARFRGLKALMEYLASWQAVVFRHCYICGARAWVEIRPPSGPVNFQRGHLVCPCCWRGSLAPDQQAHSIVGLPADSIAPCKVNLGW